MKAADFTLKEEAVGWSVRRIVVVQLRGERLYATDVFNMQDTDSHLAAWRDAKLFVAQTLAGGHDLDSVPNQPRCDRCHRILRDTNTVQLRIGTRKKTFCSIHCTRCAIVEDHL